MMPESSPALQPVYRLDGFELDLHAGDLTRAGVRVPLQALPLRLLGVLVQNAGRVVPRDELHRRLWPDKEFADFEDGVNTAVRKLRIALDDDPEAPRLIETVRGRGYRLLITVEAFTAPAPKIVRRQKVAPAAPPTAVEVAAASAPSPDADVPAPLVHAPAVRARWAGRQAKVLAAVVLAAVAIGAWWFWTR